MSLSAVLLAGGKSSRMGADKPTLLFDQHPLWEHQLDTLRNLQPERIFVSAQVDPVWRPTDLDFVGDVQPAHGPMGGIAATLSRTQTDHLLVLAIDMPFMTHDYLSGLSQRVSPGYGVVPIMDHRAEPLAAIYPRESAADFVAALSGSDLSLQSLLRKLIDTTQLRPIVVSKNEEQLFRNLNEPGDLPRRIVLDQHQPTGRET